MSLEKRPVCTALTISPQLKYFSAKSPALVKIISDFQLFSRIPNLKACWDKRLGNLPVLSWHPKKEQPSFVLFHETVLISEPLLLCIAFHIKG